MRGSLVVAFIGLVAACQPVIDEPGSPNASGDDGFLPAQDGGPEIFQGGASITGWTEGNPDLVTEHCVSLESSVSAEISLKCTLSTDDDEVHTGTVDVDVDAVSEHCFQGLLADAEYTCTAVITSTDASGAWAFPLHTDPLPAGIPSFDVHEHDADAMAGAYTLLNSWENELLFPNKKLLILDPEGRVRWYWYLEKATGIGIDASLLDAQTILAGGGPSYPPTKIALDGTVLYQGPDVPDTGYNYHHHTEQLPSGEIFALTKEDNTSEREKCSWTGFAIEVRDPATDEVTWTWRSQTGVDAQQLADGTCSREDPYHANSVSLIDDAWGPAAWVSLAHEDQLIRVDRLTGEVTHTLGDGGDFELIGADAWFSGQHAPEFRWPLVLLHDNGNRNPLVDQSSAMELELDLDTLTATVTWSWTEAGWYEPLFGDADHLSNGNVLLARGRCWDGCPTYDLPEDRLSSVVEVAPTGDVVWRLVLEEDHSLYRADRLDGCALFANGKYCP